MPESNAIPLTIGITTRSRPNAIVRCLASIAPLGDRVQQVIVVDDTSDVPVERLLDRCPADVVNRIVLVRHPSGEGNIVGRNTIVRLAPTEYVLLMDDDAFVLDPEGVWEPLALLANDPRIGVVGCAMANLDGSPWPAAMQAAPVSYTCYVSAFIGFAHLIRRSVFLEVGGYREALHYYGEEKEFCRRLITAGYDIVYMPSALVAHVPDGAARSRARYLRYVVRNDCLCAVYTDPLPLALVTAPLYLGRYFLMRRGWKVNDPAGFLSLARDIATVLPSALRNRTPMTLAAMRRWRALRRECPAYRPEQPL